jgi:hypothetical protein
MTLTDGWTSRNKMTLQSSPKKYGKIIKTNEPINVSMSMFLRCSYYVYSQQELSTCLAGEKSICVNVSMSTFLSFFIGQYLQNQLMLALVGWVVLGHVP